MKRNFTVIIEETISQEFMVSADNYNEAMAIAKEKYKNCEFVLEPGNLIAKKIAVCSDAEQTEFLDFQE